mmetsp:Transcript_525/g.789  ORF Transcript_525/g.789 Transcript_525/m.789 type:complete len:409 (-) Transcript_525:349-1575(-)|eukprot:CAMPEP_0194209580 /NCGR_PEP_ID=MMETSP0156-20130528/7655_1 /TAXON_ID=33649 /ORGANISM="Thalassionema nitzschioides, Strain L26-B" /LENGTH=408 /DNA_ID=CAMNT_0038936777 /DNA_START=153 /DNA_END=1379 /DNA_ORIENTATION=-
MRATFPYTINQMNPQFAEAWLLQQQMGITFNNNNNNNVPPALLANFVTSSSGSSDPLIALASSSHKLENSTTTTKTGREKRSLRPDQADKWNDHFDNLVRFHKQHNHCLVPHTFPEKPDLARWVKRQRYQYKLFQQGKPTGMSIERVKLLEDIGFVWDSHKAAWHKTFLELLDFKKEHGNCEVPAKYDRNPALATWVNRQRGQYKLYRDGKQSSMTLQRYLALEEAGFKWEIRPIRNSKKRKSVIMTKEQHIAAPPKKTQREEEMTTKGELKYPAKDIEPLKHLPVATQDYDFFMNMLCDLSDTDDGNSNNTANELNDIELAPLELPRVETMDATADVETTGSIDYKPEETLSSNILPPASQTRGILLDVLSDMDKDDRTTRGNDDNNMHDEDESCLLDLSGPLFPDM